MPSPISPIDAHDVAEYVVIEAYDAGQRIADVGTSHDGDVDKFLTACAALAPYLEAVRWLTGRATGTPSDEAVEVISQARLRWQEMHAEDTVAEDIASGQRLDAQFARVLQAIGGDA